MRAGPLASQVLTDRSIWSAQPRRAAMPLVVVAGVFGIALVGLLARLMTFPIRHDEQMYLPPGVLMGAADLYRDFGFNNLPNLPLLVHAVVATTGTDHYLLAGRLAVFAGWLLAAALLYLIVRRETASDVAGLCGALLLVTSAPVLGTPGMLVTNNFLPLPFALLGLYLFLLGVDRPTPRWPAIVAGGVCLAVAAGFKANYVFLLPPFGCAALLLPRRDRPSRRLVTVALPLTVGAIVGSLPVLQYLARDPDAFLAHVVRYHRGPHILYWLANNDLDGPKVMSLPGKLMLAESIWLSGATLLVLVFIVYCAARFVRRGAADRPLWPVLLVGGLVAGASLVSFIPTPAFPQYYVAPIPFAIVLAAMLYARLDGPGRTAALPLAVIGIAISLAIATPRLLPALPSAFAPTSWTGNRVHGAVAGLATAVAQRGDGRTIATLSPLYAIEAGLAVYPELAAGPLVYRVGDLIPAADRRYYRMVSPATLSRTLDARPPAAVLVGFEPSLDGAFVDWAARHGYERRPLPAIADRYGTAVVYLRPADGVR